MCKKRKLLKFKQQLEKEFEQQLEKNVCRKVNNILGSREYRFRIPDEDKFYINGGGTMHSGMYRFNELIVFAERGKDIVTLIEVRSETQYSYPTISFLIDSEYQFDATKVNPRDETVEHINITDPVFCETYIIPNDVIEKLSVAKSIEFSAIGKGELSFNNMPYVKHGVIEETDVEIKFFKFCNDYLKKNPILQL